MRQPTILTCCDYFLPGYKAGGPIATMETLVDNLGEEFAFKVITRDRDIKETRPYADIKSQQWVKAFGAEVYYLPRELQTAARMAHLLQTVDYDLLYINSLFSPLFSILPLLACKASFKQRRVLVAPRGELASGALSIKSQKKRAFLRVARMLGMHRGVLWQASSPHERDDIHRIMGRDATIALAPNLPRPIAHVATADTRHKRQGEIRLLFLGRVSAVKNTAEALRILRHEFEGKITFDIAGTKESENYWNECVTLANALPENITVRFLGAVPAQDVSILMRQYHLLFLPTTGENFGHAIIEAMMSGCPALISDRTPWRNLEPEGAGWDFPLQARDRFRSTIQDCLDMDQKQYLTLRETTRAYVETHFSRDVAKEQNRQLFYQALGPPTVRRSAA